MQRHSIEKRPHLQDGGYSVNAFRVVFCFARGSSGPGDANSLIRAAFKMQPRTVRLRSVFRLAALLQKLADGQSRRYASTEAMPWVFSGPRTTKV